VDVVVSAVSVVGFNVVVVMSLFVVVAIVEPL